MNFLYKALSLLVILSVSYILIYYLFTPRKFLMKVRRVFIIIESKAVFTKREMNDG